MEISYQVPENLESVFQRKKDDLYSLGFIDSECTFWAAVYCREYDGTTEETSEKVIETFGSNLLHSPTNVEHLAKILDKRGLNERVEQLLAAMNKIEDERHQRILAKRKQTQSEGIHDEDACSMAVAEQTYKDSNKA